MADWKSIGNYPFNSATKMLLDYFNSVSNKHPILTPDPLNIQGIEYNYFYYNQKGALLNEYAGVNPTPVPDWNNLNGQNLDELFDNLKGDEASFFSHMIPIAQDADMSLKEFICLKPTGYGADSGIYTKSKGGDLKTKWKIISLQAKDDSTSSGLKKIQLSIINHLNSVELKDLHPIQTKVCIQNTKEGQCYATILYTTAYANTAPNTFTRYISGIGNCMILPYCNLNGEGKPFDRWYWVPYRFANISKGYGNHGYGNLSGQFCKTADELVTALEELTPAQQFMARISNVTASRKNYFCLSYPIGFCDGYKRLSDDYDPKSWEVTPTSQTVSFLNLYYYPDFPEIEVNVFKLNERKEWELLTNLSPLAPRKAKREQFNVPRNAVFKFVNADAPFNLLGVYQLVDTPDLHDHSITIPIEPQIVENSNGYFIYLHLAGFNYYLTKAGESFKFVRGGNPKRTDSWKVSRISDNEYYINNCINTELFLKADNDKLIVSTEKEIWTYSLYGLCASNGKYLSTKTGTDVCLTDDFEIPGSLIQFLPSYWDFHYCYLQLDGQNLYINTPSDPKDLDLVTAYEKSPTYAQDQLWRLVPYDGYYQIILASNPNLSLFLVEDHICLKSPSLSDDKGLWVKIDNGDGTFILRNKFQDPYLGDNNYLTLASGAPNNTPLTISPNKSEVVSIKIVSP